MTSIDFYTHVAIASTSPRKLVAKAFAQHGSVRVLTRRRASRPTTLDRCCGSSRRSASFRIAGSAAGSPPKRRSGSTTLLEHQGPAAVLINLHAAPPPFFSRFERLAEIVGADEADAAAARERFRFYRERGYELRTAQPAPSAS